MKKGNTQLGLPTDRSQALVQLQDRIVQAGNQLSKDSVAVAGITNLFMPLLGKETIVLQSPLYGFPNDNALAITAKVELFFDSTGANPLYDGVINFQFIADPTGQNITSLVFNTDPAALTSSFKQLATYSLLPSSISFSPDQWPDAAIEGLQIVFDSSINSLSIINTAAGNWNFIGYTGIQIKSPHIIVKKNYTDTGGSNFSTSVGGTLSGGENLDVPVEVGLPIGLLGWTINSGNFDLNEGLGVIGSLLMLDRSFNALLPDSIVGVLSAITVQNLLIRFNPSTTTVNGVYLNIAQKNPEPWEILTGKIAVKDFAISVSAQQLLDKELVTNGQISGVLVIDCGSGDEKIEVYCSVPIPAFDGGIWEIAVGRDQEAINFSLIVKAIQNLIDVDIISILPDKLNSVLEAIMLDEFILRFEVGEETSITQISFSIYADARWQLPMLQNEIFLDDIKLQLDIQKDDKGKYQVNNGLVSGTINLDQYQVTIPVSLSKNAGENGWALNITSDYIPLPSLTALAPFMGSGIISSSFPPGVMDLGTFALYNIVLNYKFGTGGGLKIFGFTIQSSPDTLAWNLVPGYFALTDLFATLTINNKTALDKDISGSIGCTVLLKISDNPENDLHIGMLAEKGPSQAPWKFFGSLEQPIDLITLLVNGLHVPATIESLLPDKAIVEKFDLAIEPNSGAFNVNAQLNFDNGWNIIPNPLDPSTSLITLKKLGFIVDKSADGLQLEGSGEFMFLESYTASVTAKYQGKEKLWNFKGNIAKANEIKGEGIITAIHTYIGDAVSVPTFIDVQLNDVNVSLTKYENGDYEYDFALAGNLFLNINDFMISLTGQVSISAKKTAAIVNYEGSNVSGQLDFGGISISAEAIYANGGLNKFNYHFVFKGFGMDATVEREKDTNFMLFSFGFSGSAGEITLGSIINFMVEAAIGETIDIPSPWDFINTISLADFQFQFAYDTVSKKAQWVGISYPGVGEQSIINLGFIEIQEIRLRYTMKKADAEPSIVFEVSKGSFLGNNIDPASADKPGLDVLQPEKATKVPGMGDAIFRLNQLSLGNQVQIVAAPVDQLATIDSALTYLGTAFDTPSDGKELPVSLVNNSGYGWLVGGSFCLLGYINIGLLFYDPVLYGVHIGVTGGKMKGLDFQILYKKVSPNVGVYQIDLTLPDYLRKQQLGAVSITLPCISIMIYTNGDFKIDLGFPANGDFSKSFGAELTIFTGSGGFYFAKLSQASAGGFNLPNVIGKGEFNPVIAIGIGIKAGLGRSFDKGILKAELSLTLQAIFEGILAFYHPIGTGSSAVLLGDDDKDPFFRIQAQVSLVGKLYGEINFVIISASVSITVTIGVLLVMESYQQTHLTFTAAVEASASLSIDFGLFSITISFSFSTTITDSFTIGDSGGAPWGEEQRKLSSSNYFYALDKPQPVSTANMNWAAALTGYPKIDISVYLSPSMSVKYEATGMNRRVPATVAMFTIQTNNMSGTGGEDSEFVKVAKAALAWTFNAYFNNGSDILSQVVTIDDIQEIINYLNDKDFPGSSFNGTLLLEQFFQQCFSSVKIKAIAETENGSNYSIFPVFPVLSMALPNSADPSHPVIVDFQNYNIYTSQQLDEIKQYFKAMQVQNQDGSFIHRSVSEESTSLANYFFVDYFSMILKYGFGAIKELVQQLTATIGAPTSLQQLVDAHPNYGKTVDEIAFANRHQLLNQDIDVEIPAIRYRLKQGEANVEVLASRFPHIPFSIWDKSFHANLSVGDTIDLPSFVYRIKKDESHSLRSLAEFFNVKMKTLAQVNKDVNNFFAKGTRLIVPMVASITVGELLQKLNTPDNRQLDNLGGTLSRFFLHGLRLPAKAVGDQRKGLYEAIGQQFSPVGFVKDDQIIVQLNEQNKSNPALSWLNFENLDVKNTSFKITDEFVANVNNFQQSTYTADLPLLPQDQILRYRLMPKTFVLPDKVTWDNPNPSQLGNCFAWKFTDKLQQLLKTSGTLAVTLNYQSFNSSFSVELPKEIVPLFWATVVEIKIAKSPTLTDPSKNLDFVYTVAGCGESDAALLLAMIADQAFAPSGIYFLYNKDKTKPSDVKINGLTSAPQTDWKSFLLQTNFSTESNPPTLSNLQLNDQDNLVGMDAKTFLTYLWECSVVHSGGYYLYYQDTVLKKGFPADIFDQQGNASITLLLTHTIPSLGEGDEHYYQLPSYVNDVIITKDIVPTEDNIYVEPYLTPEQLTIPNPNLLEQVAIVPPGNSMFKGSRDNPDLLNPTNPPAAVEKQLKQLYSLLEYWIEATPNVYQQSNFALPAGPTKAAGMQKGFCLSKPLEHIETDPIWQYEGVASVYKSTIANPTDPYSSNQKPVTIAFNFLDIFGNTLVDENVGTSLLNQQITNAYTDNIIALDEWPALSKAYTLSSDTVLKASFQIDFKFDPETYAIRDKDGKLISVDVAKAARDEQTYQQLHWQIIQTDVEIHITNTLDNQSFACKDAIFVFVANIITALKTIQSGTLPEAVLCPVSFAVNTVNAEVTFCLKVVIEIERNNIQNIDPQFQDVPGVRFASSFIPPGFYGEKAMHDFAKKFEDALPYLKIALGESKSGMQQQNTLRETIAMGSEDSTGNQEVWITRWQYLTGDETFKGINFEVAAPAYFAIKPLATALISRPSLQKNTTVPIRKYNGTYIATDDSNITQEAFTGIDIQALAQTFITAIDEFYSAEISTAAWQIQNDAKSLVCNPDAPDPLNCPFKVIEIAKRKIASAIADKQLVNILGNPMADENLNQAKEALYQRLLVKLGYVNTIASILQSGVKITDGVMPAALYGTLKSTSEKPLPKSFDFSPAKLSLAKESGSIGTFFSIRSEADSGVTDNKNFEATLNWHLTAMEHDYQPGIDGYESSSWLTFVIPVEISNGSAALIDANIPIPLKAYPTAPSLQFQQGTASANADGKTARERLEEAKQWDYTFDFGYIAAAQDSIYANVTFNNTNNSGFGDVFEPDLFDALSQFNAVYQILLTAIKNNSLPALQSFAWAVQQVANTWSAWDFGLIRSSVNAQQVQVDFKITELKEADSADLVIKLDKLAGYPFISFPSVLIDGLLVDKIGEGVYKYYQQQESGQEPTYVKFADRHNYPQRNVILEQCDLLNYENAWAGVAIHRNEELIEGMATNPDFVYKTPYIRFKDYCIPSLTNNDTFDIAAFSTGSPSEKRYLAAYFQDFFKAFFNQDPITSNNIIQLECSYTYGIQESTIVVIDSLRASIPILLTVPGKYSDELMNSIEAQIINGWLKTYHPQGIATDGSLNISLSVFTSLTAVNTKTPMLKLTNLYLDTKLIKLD